MARNKQIVTAKYEALVWNKHSPLVWSFLYLQSHFWEISFNPVLAKICKFLVSIKLKKWKQVPQKTIFDVKIRTNSTSKPPKWQFYPSLSEPLSMWMIDQNWVDD